ncbi:hypothetical protein SAMN05445871_5491 [Paraburkholderia caballeronis]|uniref:Uncharacterized protein n=1 Tax=Paraburkholderia caballeronis TaxID=416943 RepID=A0A1H7RPL0_9BURK|nr:hypothetical protein C7403_111117 [Paraburkholderia caballeronis]PXW97799.1 hypothetical protein C7407_111117 [Paraburkholderia caballeronis]RAJ94769.1 hypothetical protein C7409_111117 [Paraburkholderia caballeronis]SEE61607.1 hypothetical protein SAMN05445871_5491 [Paraburkholderia caballeronis]SEL61969.1 hypothetical protein SAMN05192542_110117 [Paraburkholderia caballeronis]
MTGIPPLTYEPSPALPAPPGGDTPAVVDLPPPRSAAGAPLLAALARRASAARSRWSRSTWRRSANCCGPRTA